MKDSLESFIQHNRAEFDTEMPSLKAWAGIDRQLQHGRRRRQIRRWAVPAAAAIVMLLGIGITLGWYAGNRGPISGNIASLTSISDVDFSAEQVEALKYYQKEITQKSSLLASYNYDNSFHEDLQLLDESLNELVKQLDDAPACSKERLLQSIILNYQTRVQIMERALDRYQSIDQNYEENEMEEISI